MDESLTGTATLGQIRLVSNSHERVLPRSPELDSHHQMQFSVIPFAGDTVSISPAHRASSSSQADSMELSNSLTIHRSW